MAKRPSQRKVQKNNEEVTPTDPEVTIANSEVTFVVRLETSDVRKNVTVDEFIGMQEGLMRPTRDAIARFVYNKATGEKLATDEALRAIGRLSLDDMDTLVQDFREGVMEIAVPKGRAEG